MADEEAHFQPDTGASIGCLYDARPRILGIAKTSFRDTFSPDNASQPASHSREPTGRELRGEIAPKGSTWV